MSLGSIGYVPLAIMYRGPVVARLSDFKGKRLALGAEGARELSLALLKMNGIVPGGSTELLPTAGEDAATALLDGKIDAAFLSGDSTQIPVMAKLFRAPGVRVFVHAGRGVRAALPYLTAITLPMGSTISAGTCRPPTSTRSRRPSNSSRATRCTRVVRPADRGRARGARPRDDPAARGRIPSPVTRGFQLSDDAARYYKSGKTFLYRRLPFWVASLVDRLLVVVVPLIVVLIPGLRLVPSLYGWRVRSRIYRWYGALIALERSALGEHGRARAVARRTRRHRGSREPDEDAAGVCRAVLCCASIGFVRERLTAHGTRRPARRAPAARSTGRSRAAGRHAPRATPGSA